MDANDINNLLDFHWISAYQTHSIPHSDPSDLLIIEISGKMVNWLKGADSGIDSHQGIHDDDDSKALKIQHIKARSQRKSHSFLFDC